MLVNHAEQLNSGTLTVRGLLENEGLGLVEALNQRGGDVAREIAQIGDLVTRAIESRGSTIVSHLAQKQGELTSAIDTSSASLRDNIDHHAAAAVAAVTGAQDRLRDELAGLIEELAKRNTSLDQLAGKTGQNLDLIETNLGQRIGEFETALTAINAQVANLSETSAATLAEAGSLATRLDTHGRALAHTSHELRRSQTEVDASLADRVNSLESLLTRVNEKSDDLDSVMRAFSGMIDESFNSAEVRAREIGTFLAESTQGSKDAIGQHFEAVRSSTAKERERTAAALRAAYEQARSEMEEIFSGTAERFKGSTEELLAMSNSIRRELDATRQELRRSASELPQETAAQAATLRRVVADQISALNELTDVVNRSGRSLDFAEPQAARATEPVRQPEPQPRAPEPRRYAEPAPVAVREDFLRPRAPTPPPAPAPRATPNLPSTSGERGPGWLSEILNRASRDEKPEARGNAPAPRPAASSLDTISLDIARMINHEAAVDLWDRYRNGERNVFGRHLYTTQGQKTFEEIRRRYRGDTEFRETVNRYISEFERLLGEVNRDDRDGSVTRTYLSSDTGKVYTMLAHAAGRFE